MNNENSILTGAEKFDIIARNSVEGILIINDTGCIEEWNDYMVEKTGYLKAEICGRKIWDVHFSLLTKEWQRIYPVESLQKIWMNFFNDLKENEFSTKEGQFLSKNKEIVLTEDIICRIILQKKDYLYVIQRDRGRRKRIEHEDVIASIISFELKSLISGLLDLSGLYVKESRRLNIDKLLNFIKQIISSSEHTIKVLQNFSMFLSVQNGSIRINPVETDLNPIISDIIGEFSSAAVKKNIVLQYIPGDDIFCAADTYILKIILRNIVDNALKFTNPGGSVIISASVRQDFVEIRIADNGVGIDSETRKRLFLSESKITTRGTKEEEGTGLGLILIKNLIEKQGGKIWVESEVNKGSTFVFTIPVECG